MNTNHFTLSFMELDDIQESAKVLSLAMLDNPMHRAVFQGNSEKERFEIEKMFLELFAVFPGITFLAKHGKKIIGVMRMKSCVGPTDKGKSNKVRLDGENNSRKSIWLDEWARNDPEEQHWHLGPIGVLPAYRGVGVGSMLMERFCEEVDRCSAKAYLETDLDANVRFYGKFGFQVVSEAEIFQVNNRYMARDIQPVP